MKKLNKLGSTVLAVLFIIATPLSCINFYASNSIASDLLPEVSKVDSEEMSDDDWDFVLNLDSAKKGGDDFSFIKNNTSNNNVQWILYLAIILLSLSGIGIIFVILCSIKRLRKHKRGKHITKH